MGRRIWVTFTPDRPLRLAGATGVLPASSCRWRGGPGGAAWAGALALRMGGASKPRRGLEAGLTGPRLPLSPPGDKARSSWSMASPSQPRRRRCLGRCKASPSPGSPPSSPGHTTASTPPPSSSSDKKSKSDGATVEPGARVVESGPRGARLPSAPSGSDHAWVFALRLRGLGSPASGWGASWCWSPQVGPAVDPPFSRRCCPAGVLPAAGTVTARVPRALSPVGTHGSPGPTDPMGGTELGDWHPPVLATWFPGPVLAACLSSVTAVWIMALQCAWPRGGVEEMKGGKGFEYQAAHLSAE